MATLPEPPQAEHDEDEFPPYDSIPLDGAMFNALSKSFHPFLKMARSSLVQETSRDVIVMNETIKLHIFFMRLLSIMN